MSHVIIDTEFKAVNRALTADEYDALREKIRREGAKEPIWFGAGPLTDTVLDGHNRLGIYEELMISEYPTAHAPVETRNAAIDWIVEHQLSRRNLNREERDYLLGKRYNREKAQGKRSADGQTTADRLGAAEGLSGKTITRAAEFATAVDTIERNVDRGAAQEIRQGKARVSAKVVTAIAKGPPEGQAQAYSEARGSKSKPKLAVVSDNEETLPAPSSAPRNWPVPDKSPAETPTPVAPVTQNSSVIDEPPEEQGNLRDLIKDMIQRDGLRKTVDHMKRALPPMWRNDLDRDDDGDIAPAAEYDGRNFAEEVRDLNRDWTDREIEDFTEFWTGPQKGSLTRTLPKLREKLDALTPPQRRSRAQSWEDAAGAAVSAIEELIEHQSEFAEWRSNLDNAPYSLQEGPVVEKLDVVGGLDLDSALEAVNEAADVELPLGFGRG